MRLFDFGARNSPWPAIAAPHGCRVTVCDRSPVVLEQRDIFSRNCLSRSSNQLSLPKVPNWLVAGSIS